MIVSVHLLDITNLEKKMEQTFMETQKKVIWDNRVGKAGENGNMHEQLKSKRLKESTKKKLYFAYY